MRMPPYDTTIPSLRQLLPLLAASSLTYNNPDNEKTTLQRYFDWLAETRQSIWKGLQDAHNILLGEDYTLETLKEMIREGSDKLARLVKKAGIWRLIMLRTIHAVQAADVEIGRLLAVRCQISHPDVRGSVLREFFDVLHARILAASSVKHLALVWPEQSSSFIEFLPRSLEVLDVPVFHQQELHSLKARLLTREADLLMLYKLHIRHCSVPVVDMSQAVCPNNHTGPENKLADVWVLDANQLELRKLGQGLGSFRIQSCRLTNTASVSR